MGVLNDREVADALRAFFGRTQTSALFAGAGVGCRAGFPSWPKYLEMLASTAEPYDATTALLIRERVTKKQYLEAASVYCTCSDIPYAERYRGLAQPFRPVKGERPMLKALSSLVALPFKCAVTTNFDRSLHDSFAETHQVSPLQADLGVGTLSQAAYWTDFYIARVHGGYERPETMVLDVGTYKITESDAGYRDFLTHIFRNRPCLFVGYSFVDPAINRVFELISQTLNKMLPQTHLALVPSDADALLIQRLKDYNIDVAVYDADEEHKALWRGIWRCKTNQASADGSTPSQDAVAQCRPPDVFEHAHRFLSLCYARVMLHDTLRPLRSLVFEGIVARLLLEAAEDRVSLGELAASLRASLPMKEDEARSVVEDAIETLAADGTCVLAGESVSLAKPLAADCAEKALDTALANRFMVRENRELPQQLQHAARRVFEDMFLLKGWELSASFVGSELRQKENFLREVHDLCRKHCPSQHCELIPGLASSILDLVMRPTAAESKVIADLGRASFAVQLVLSSGSTVLHQLHSLPQAVYLDANVLMPAITDGHPIKPAYADSINALKQSIQRTGMVIEILAAEEFLNEIVTHRRNAISTVRDLNLEEPEELKKIVMLMGAENINVFIGAYASAIGRGGKSVRFVEFLDRVAPYATEDDLRRHLLTMGIATQRLAFDDGAPVQAFHGILHALKSEYASECERAGRVKADVLIEHEARQLARVEVEIRGGRRAIFVTADARLRRIVARLRDRALSGAVFSQSAFIQLVDLMLGVQYDAPSLSRVIWMMNVGDDRETLRNYLINRALSHFDAAKAKAMPEVLDIVVEKAADDAKRERIDLLPSSPSDLARTARFIDRMEDAFFEKMADVMRTTQP